MTKPHRSEAPTRLQVTYDKTVLLFVVSALFAGCSSNEGAAVDGSVSVDAMAQLDATAIDAPLADAADNNVVDASTVDGAIHDSAVPDAMTPDATPGLCGYPGNLITLCGFDADDSGWTVAFNASTSYNSSEGHSGAGSLQMEMAGIPGQSNWSSYHTTCFPLTANTAYTFGVWVRELGGAAVNVCHAQLRVYSNVSDCSGAVSAQVAPTVSVDSTWRTSEGSYTASASGDSGRLRVRCQGGAAGSQVLVDDAYLRP